MSVRSFASSGPGRTRTGYLLCARQALFLVSYKPAAAPLQSGRLGTWPTSRVPCASRFMCRARPATTTAGSLVGRAESTGVEPARGCPQPAFEAGAAAICRLDSPWLRRAPCWRRFDGRAVVGKTTPRGRLISRSRRSALGAIRTLTVPVLSRLPLPVGLRGRRRGALGAIRTRTVTALDRVPLPVGLRERGPPPDSNRAPSPYEGDALPDELGGRGAPSGSRTRTRVPAHRSLSPA